MLPAAPETVLSTYSFCRSEGVASEFPESVLQRVHPFDRLLGWPAGVSSCVHWRTIHLRRPLGNGHGFAGKAAEADFDPEQV